MSRVTADRRSGHRLGRRHRPRRRRHDRPALRRRRGSPRTTSRTEAYGTIDEAVAALGPGPRGARRQAPVRRRSTPASPALGRADPAAPARAVRGRRGAGRPPRTPGTGSRTARPASPRAMVDGLDRAARRARGADRDARASSSSPGETRTSAALELARTIVRRAERRAVTLERDGLAPRSRTCYRT